MVVVMMLPMIVAIKVAMIVVMIVVMIWAMIVLLYFHGQVIFIVYTRSSSYFIKSYLYCSCQFGLSVHVLLFVSEIFSITGGSSFLLPSFGCPGYHDTRVFLTFC